MTQRTDDTPETHRLVESRDDLDPPNLDVPIKKIDTTNDHNPSVAKLARWVRTATKGRGG